MRFHRPTAFALSALALLLTISGSRAEIRDDIVGLMDQVSNFKLNEGVYDMEAYGTRFCASQNAWTVAHDLMTRMSDLGWETGLQEFTFDHDTLGVVTSWNVVARRSGTAPNATVILSAHWDSVDEQPGGSYDDPEAPAPGANDNGSGVSVLLEIARVLKDHQFIQNVEIVFFGAEETHLEGSQAYVAQHNELETNIAGVFNVDSVGYDDDELWDFTIVSDHQSEWFMWNTRQWAWDYAPELTPQTWSIPGGWSNSDAYSFWQNNPPDPAVSIWEGRWDIPEEHAPFGNHSQDTYNNCISGYGDFMTSMARFVLAAFCEWAIVGDKATDVADLPGSDTDGLSVYPNPFSERTAIRFAADSGGAAGLQIHDLQGRLVRRLPVTTGNPVSWDGRDDRGGKLSAGVYFLSSARSPELGSRRVVLLR